MVGICPSTLHIDSKMFKNILHETFQKKIKKAYAKLEHRSERSLSHKITSCLNALEEAMYKEKHTTKPLYINLPFGD